MLRSAPGRGSSCNPSTRCLTKRLRHLPTVAFVECSDRATAVFVNPVAQRKTTRARNARAGFTRLRLARRSSAHFSSSPTSSFAFGRPVRAMRPLRHAPLTFCGFLSSRALVPPPLTPVVPPPDNPPVVEGETSRASVHQPPHWVGLQNLRP